MVAPRSTGRVRATFGPLILIIAVFGPKTLYAQIPMAPAPAMSLAGAAAPTDVETNTVRLLVGRSAIVPIGSKIARVSLTVPEVADALVTAPDELLLNGKMPGSISMFVWDRAGAVRRFDVIVQRDLARLNQQLEQLFPGEPIAVQANGRSIVVSGKVSSKEVIERAVNLASGYVEKKDEVVSLMQVADGGVSDQVLLHVRFAEVSRNALTELGASYYSDGYKNTVGSVTTQQFPTPFFNQEKPMVGNSQVFSDYLNLFLFDFKHQLGAVVKALQSKGLFQSLAEPNLVAQSGKEASFLAGGEFPIPVAQTSGSQMSITVQFKEFGIRLNFTPTVNGQRIQLKVRPEVSSLDFNNAVVLNGFRIPALSTRRTETELELLNGQTFAIAGLLNNTMTSSLKKIPGIGDIPILGLLFQSKAAQKDQTELVVMITPEILRNNSTGVTPSLPRIIEPFLEPVPQKKTMEPPPPAFKLGASSSSQIELPAPAPAAAAVVVEPDPRDPKRAATTMMNLLQGGPTVLREEPVVPTRAPGAEPTSPATPATPAAAMPTQLTPSPLPQGGRPMVGEERPMSREEKQAAERARKEEREHLEVEMRARAEEARRRAEQDDEDRRQAKKEGERLAKLQREQAKREAEAAKKAAEEAKVQAEIDQRHQKAIDEAANKLKAAEAAYQAELAKRGPGQQAQ